MSDPRVIAWIKKAARETGADPVAMLADSLVESNAELGHVGDGGTSFGPYQFHVGGALGSHTPAWANSYEAVLNRAQEFARLGVHGGAGAYAVQRPADRAGYTAKVDSRLGEARQLLNTVDAAYMALGKKPPKRAPGGRQTAPAGFVGVPVHLPPRHFDVALKSDPSRSAFRAPRDTASLDYKLPPRLDPKNIHVPEQFMGQLSTPGAKPAIPVGRPAPAKTGLLTPGGGWGGSKNLAHSMAAIGLKNGLHVISEKRDRKSTASGGVSDHWTGSKTSYAYDISNGTSPTPQMDRTAAQIAARLGVKNWKGGVLNVNRGGYRYQLLYRTNVGGNHYNHVHVGVRKI